LNFIWNNPESRSGDREHDAPALRHVTWRGRAEVPRQSVIRTPKASRRGSDRTRA
jgi:hypothetical protein